MSRYSRLLTKIIAESGLTAKEVIEKCNEMGNGIDTTRLSKLQNGKLSAPSEKVSRDLCKVCNADERLLVLEGYLEKAPKEITEAFMNFKKMSTFMSLNVFKNNIDKKTFKKLEEELEKEPLANFIVSMIDDKKDIIMNMNIEDIAILEELNDTFSLSLTEPISLEVKDNAMFPIIPENSKINLFIQSDYKTGELVAVKVKKTDDVLVRYLLLNGNNIILNSLNSKYEQLTFKKEEIIFLGKVVRVITEL